jgi:hypothetical protein
MVAAVVILTIKIAKLLLRLWGRQLLAGDTKETHAVQSRKTPHQANAGDPLDGSGAPNTQSERLERSLCLASNEQQKEQFANR